VKLNELIKDGNNPDIILAEYSSNSSETSYEMIVILNGMSPQEKKVKGIKNLGKDSPEAVSIIR